MSINQLLAIATLLGGFSAVFYFWEKIHRWTFIRSLSHIFRSENKTSTRLGNLRAMRIIKKHFSFKKISLDSIGAIWIALNPDRIPSEFYTLYQVNNVTYFDVFTIRFKEPENLLHRISIGELLTPMHIKYDEKIYLVCGSTQGSGAYLSLTIYSYDGIGKLKIVHEEGLFFQGNYRIINDRCFISGNNKRYELIYSNEKFSLSPYKERLRYEFGSTQHILAYDIIEEQLQIKFDGKPLEFMIRSNQLHLVSPLRINFNEHILVDDNLTENPNGGIRTLTTGGDFISFGGFFMTLKPNIHGLTSLAISYCYQEWYIIDIIVT
jgi:hypothetical protein